MQDILISKFQLNKHQIVSKVQLNQLCNRLSLENNSDVIDAISFFVKDSKGLWHNRARAKIARKLKHIELDQIQKNVLSKKILERLGIGDFSEQFDDQVQLLLQIMNHVEIKHEIGKISKSTSKIYILRMISKIDIKLKL